MALNNNGLNESVCQSYLLRIWRDGEEGEWRATLLTIPTQERHQFTSMEGLFNFLEYRTDHPVPKMTAFASVAGHPVIEEANNHITKS
jgi:hypothetical protein